MSTWRATSLSYVIHNAAAMCTVCRTVLRFGVITSASMINPSHANTYTLTFADAQPQDAPVYQCMQCSIVTWNSRSISMLPHTCTSWYIGRQAMWLVQSASQQRTSGKRCLAENRLLLRKTHGQSWIPNVALSSPSGYHWWAHLSISALSHMRLKRVV